MNFPPQLAIRAFDPSSALGHFINRDSIPKCLERLVFDDESLTSSQNKDILSYGIAGRIWEAAYAMSLYLQPSCTLDFEPQCPVLHGQGAILELGSGNGFLGFQVAQLLSLQPVALTDLSKSLILTDLEVVCPLLHRNRQQFMKSLPNVDLVIQPLEWGNLEHGNILAATLVAGRTATPQSPLLSHVLCSDLVYFPELYAPLLRTLLQVSSPPFSTAEQPVQIILSYMIRSLTKESIFWSAFGMWFDFVPVLVRQKSCPSESWERFGGHRDDIMFIFVATRKPESLHWPVPNDSGLIQGYDETFETLLFMNIATQ